MKLRLFSFLWAVLLISLTAAPASARSLPPRPGLPPEIGLRSLQVEAEVDRNVARVRFEQVFVNQGARPAEGTYLFPLPKGAGVESFQMYVDGQAFSGEVLDAGKARGIYESIVRQNRDPALLQYLGQGLLQARIFPVPPGAERRIRIEYSQVLPGEGGLTELSLPLGADPIPDLAVTVTLRQPGATIYSPTHDVAVTREGGTGRVSFEGKDARGDLRLFLGGETGDLGVNLLTYKPAGEDGYFLLVANPPADGRAEVIAKDVILVVDLSGSMQGEKFEQAKAAALQVLGALGADDRFAVIGFHSDVTAYADGLRPAAEAGRAMDWVRGLRIGGSTNISGAIERAQLVAGRPDGRPQAILLITDGQPTVGEQDPDRIVQGVQARTSGSQRIFTFGVGYDVNTRLLDAMAQENRGRSEYVRPGENLESAVSGLWRRVGQPVLSDVRLEWQGVTVSDLYPRPVPDLYLGSQLVLLGRYRGDGAGRLTVRGRVNGADRSYSFSDLRFATSVAPDRDYIPRLWANRKVAWLLGEVRPNGSHQEVLSEIVSLAQRYGIVTPYTSFFINEPNQGPVTAIPQPAQLAPGAAASRAPAKVEQAMKAAPQTGAAAVETAAQIGNLREAKSLSSAQPQGAAAGQVRSAGAKTFLLRQGIWVDSVYGGGTLTHLKLGSDKYLELVRRRPDLAKYLAVGTPLVVVDGSINLAVDYPGADEGTEPLPAQAAAPPASPPGKGATALWLSLGMLAAICGAAFRQMRGRAPNRASSSV